MCSKYPGFIGTLRERGVDICDSAPCICSLPHSNPCKGWGPAPHSLMDPGDNHFLVGTVGTCHLDGVSKAKTAEARGH